MPTEFNDAAHWGFFMTGTTLTSSTGKYIRVSELTLAALRDQGVFDNMEDGTVPPALDKLWLDKNTDPAVLKEWDPTGSAWAPMTFERLFGRAIVTAMATPTGTANALVVAAPSPFIPHRMYSLTPIADNSGAATIQVTGVGTYDIKYTDGSALEEHELKAGNPSILLFTGARFEVLFKVSDVYQAALDAQEAADAALAAANAGFVFDTQSAFESTNVPAILFRVTVGIGVYKHDKIRISTPSPIEAWHSQSNDGAWWEIDAPESRPEYFAAIVMVASPWGASQVAAATDAGQAILDAREYALAKGRVLVLETGVYKSTKTLTVSTGFNIEGGGTGWYDRGVIPSALKLSGTTILFVGTGPKDKTARGVTDCRTSGGVLANPDTTNAYNANYSLNNYYNENANTGTGLGATPIGLSAGVYVEQGAQGWSIRNLNIVLSNDGVAKYDNGTLGWADDWDIGIYVDGADEGIIDNVNVIGYWRKNGYLARGNAFPGEIASPTTFTGIERVRVSNCNFQGLKSIGVRGSDHYRVTAFTSSYIEIPWATNHPFNLDINTGARFGVGELTITTNFTITALAKVGDFLRITTNTDPSVAIGVGTFIQPAWFGSGCAGHVFENCLSVGLFHQSNRRSTDSLNALPISSALEVSGARMRGLQFDGRINSPDDVMFHLHTCYGMELKTELEGKTQSTGASGGRCIASPASSTNTRVTYPGPGTTDLRMVDIGQILNADLTPIYGSHPAAFAAGSFFMTSGLEFSPFQARSQLYLKAVNVEKGIYSWSGSIADDAVATITFPFQQFSFVTTISTTISGDPWGSFKARAAASSNHVDVGGIINPTNFAGVTTALTGTTGVDGKMTVGVQNSQLQIENRLGGSRTVKVTFENVDP